MNLEEARNEWSKDCEIDDIELDKSSLEVPKLHAKYQEFLTDNILILKNLEFQYNTLRLRISGYGITEKCLRNK